MGSRAYCSGRSAGVDYDWCGLCYENRRGRSNHKGHWGHRAPSSPYRENLSMALARRDREASAGATGGLPADSDFLQRYPLICEHLSATTFADGSRRKTSTLTLFVDQGRLKVSLNDREQSMVAFLSAEGLVDLLDALEAALESDSLDWRTSGFVQKNSKKST